MLERNNEATANGTLRSPLSRFRWRLVGLALGVVSILTVVGAVGMMVVNDDTEPPLDAAVSRISLLEQQVQLMNLGDTWEYEIERVLACVPNLNPDPDDYGPYRRSWRAQLRASGGAQTLGTFTPVGSGLHFIDGRQPANDSSTVKLTPGTAYEIRTQQRTVDAPWGEWSDWRSCGVLLPRYPEANGKTTWLRTSR